MWSKFRWFQTSGHSERGILKTCGKKEKLLYGIQEQEAPGSLLNLSLHIIDPFVSICLENKHVPVCVLKIDVFSLFLLSIDGSMVRPQNRLQLDLDLFLS